MSKSDYSWHDEIGKAATVVPSVQAIAVYTNPKGDIVLRQEDSMGEEDSVVVIPRSMVKQVAKALQDEAKKEIEPD